MRQLSLLFVLALALALPDAVAAQGRGNGRPKQPRATTGAAAPVPAAAGARPAIAPPTMNPQFGSWLDDASTPAAGTGYTGIGIGYWRARPEGGSAAASQINAPVVGVGYGLADRVQVAATVPFYRVSYLGTTARGLDDVYVSGKVAAIDPAANGRVGLAVGSVLELLSGERGDERRVQWAIPVSLELRGDTVRVYGSTGYFSRRSVFAGGAFELTTPVGSTVTAALVRSVSLVDREGGTLPRQSLLDLSISLVQPLTPAVHAYAAAGRTFISRGAGDDAFTLSGGVAFSFSARRP